VDDRNGIVGTKGWVLRRAAWVVVVAIAAVVMAGCGSSGGSGQSTATSEPAPADDVASIVLGPFLASGGTQEQAATLLATGCAALALADPTGDSGSLGSYFTDLFDGGATGSETFVRDREAVVGALDTTCSERRGDPEGFIADVAAALDLSAADVRDAIDGACAGFDERQRANLGDPHAPESFDQRVSTVLAVVGVDRADLETLVDAYCPS
jgi:hypothetical protein